MDIVISVIAETVSKLVDATILQAPYPFRFNRYVTKLEIEKENLQVKIESVRDCAKEAKKKTEKVVSDVENWLKEADSLMAKVVELQEKAKNKRMTSCLKCCPNLIKRYSLAKQVEEKTNEILKHKEIEFSQFARLATLVGMNYFSAEGFVCFHSRQVAYDGLVKALKDDKVKMIGLYGMGGCGKTTLAKEVGKEAEQCFNKVVFVAVSNTIDVRNIQGKIAGQLSLELKEEEEPERARRLFMRLTGGERILIILDDVWEKLDFEAIGIPVDKSQTSCIVLLTTRKLDVCRVMNCKSMVPLEGLYEDEAWILFQKHAGTFDDSNTLKGLAQEITKECGGLPVAIAAVASSLKDKPQLEWDEALKTLRDSSLVDIEEGLKNPYTCLRLSYDNLKNDVAKSLLLLCSAFPEDYEISDDELTVIGVGLGLVREVQSYQRARNQVMLAKSKLTDSCLLLKLVYKGDETYVQMHDLVRDVALWIANSENKLIMGPGKSQKALKEDMILMDDKIRYLWFDKVGKFPHSLDCPELEFFYVSTKLEHDVHVKDNFFNGMEKLRVLILKSHARKTLSLQLPTSLHLINNLRCLVLCKWSLGDISFIGSLGRLESLQLQFCSFDELPKCIIQQKKLRLLESRSCEIQRNPYEVIGRCSQLEVLYFCGNYGTDWEDQVAAEFFDKNRATLALESFCINLGKYHEYYYPQISPDTKRLSVDNFETCILNATIKDLMQRANVLCLREIHTSYKNFIPDVTRTVGGGMSELTQLSLRDSDGIECILDTRKYLDLVGIISNLTHLTIVGMNHLKTLCHGQPPRGLFANLSYLIISNCSSLEHIITDEVKDIVIDDSDYQRTDTFTFPKLKCLSIYECHQLEYLMPVSFAQSLVQLDEITIYRANKLKSVFGQSIYEDPSPNKLHIIEFSALRDIELKVLPNIVSICPENYHPTWPSLKNLRLSDCPQLNIMPFINYWIASSGERQEHHIASEDLMKAVCAQQETLQSLSIREINEIDVIFHLEGLPNNGQQVKSSLNYLELANLPELRYIWMCPNNFLRLQNLGDLQIWGCENLKVVFPTSIVRSLPNLKRLYIWDCKELEKIIEDDEERQNPSNADQFVLPHLTSIYIIQCHKLKRVFPVSACRVLLKLRILVINGASQLEQIFGDEEGDTSQRKEDVIPDLEYVILSQLPRLTSGGQRIDLQSVKYMVVHESPILALTPTITPQELLKELKKQAYFDGRSELCFMLKNIIKFNDFESASEREHISSHDKTNQAMPPIQAQNNEQKFTPVASRNSTKIVQGSAIEGSTSENANTRDCLLGPTSSPNLTKAVKGSIEGSTSEKAKIVTSVPKAHPHIQTQTKLPRTEANTDEDIEAIPMINPQDFKDDNLIGLLQSMEEDYGHGVPMLCVPNVATTKDDLVAKALVDLKDSLKMPFKDIVTSKTNSLRLQTALNFLSRLSLEDGTLSDGLKAIIKSLHQDFPSILSSFKQAFATINKFTVLEERDKCIKEELAQRKEAAIALVSKMSKTKRFMDKAHEKEARLKVQISRLEKEIQDCEAELSSLQEQKKKCVAETVEFKKEFETLRTEKFELVEDQSKARQKLFQIDYKWSVLCSQFEQNIASRNLS